MSLSLIYTDIAIGAITVVTLYFYLRANSSQLPLPPGPKKLPIIGNVLEMPKEFPAKHYDDMCKKYNSDIIHLNALGTDIIILNSYEVAQELLGERSSIYSSRPKSVMFSELAGYSYLFVTMPYNALWRYHRRLFTKYFHPKNTEINQPRETEQVHILLEKLLERPEGFMGHIRHMIGATFLSEVYGLKINSEDDPYIALANEALEHIVHMSTPGAFFVEIFPVLKYIPTWFPGAHFHQYAKKARAVSKQALEVLYNASLDAMDSEVPVQSFVYEGLQDIQNNRAVRDHTQYHQTLRELGVMTYLGALDTINASLDKFILAMMLYPEVQETAHKELDKVLAGRLPSHSDIPAIPYITALLMEILRWETTVPSGFPHMTTEDDVYRGYHIPKGSVVLPIQRSMLYDEQDYPDPHIFKPERFLKDGKINENVRSPETIAFGFGRRICPGIHLAKSTIWLAMASILTTFNIGKPLDKEGNVIEPTFRFQNVQVNHLEPFPCSITPRSKDAILLINSGSV